MMLTRATVALVVVLCSASPSPGQTAAIQTQVPASQAPADAGNGDAKDWSFSAAVQVYGVPDDRNYAQPSLTADRDRLHLEVRYNYEALDTGSAWVGYNLAGGDRVAWELTPMIGGVFGDVVAVAPGYRGTVSWWKLAFLSEGEYVFGSKDEEERFFYNWSELTVSPAADWWWVGLATQRTRAYQTDRDLQRGILAGFSFRNLESSFYVMNPDDSDPILILAVSVSF
jgi:hypothetical protein